MQNSCAISRPKNTNAHKDKAFFLHITKASNGSSENRGSFWKLAQAPLIFGCARFPSRSTCLFLQGNFPRPFSRLHTMRLYRYAAAAAAAQKGNQFCLLWPEPFVASLINTQRRRRWRCTFKKVGTK
jgi:hypothetical protein